MIRSSSRDIQKSKSARQGGFVLIMALVFLVLLTIIGITAMSTSSLEEKMAHNTKDKNLSLHAAESATTYAENWLAGLPAGQPNPDVVVATNDGLHYVSDSTLAPVWSTSTFWSSSGDIMSFPARPDGTTSGNQLEGGLAAQPRYVIEHLDTLPNCAPEEMDVGSEATRKCKVFRITGRGVGGTAVAVSMTQTTFKRPVD